MAKPRRSIGLWMLPIVVASGLLSGPRPSSACAVASPRHEAPPVEVAEEEALIVWDKAKGVEHFIRRATFRGETRDFGFLVPTPDKPELEEFDESVFRSLEEETRPRVVTETRWTGVKPTLACLCFTCAGGSRSASAPAEVPVHVIEAKQVGGYDAVVLEARSPRSLSDWLVEHGYAERPALTEWLAPYVAAGWKVSAFKLGRDEGGAMKTKPVRMSFKTERPFFPYREPADQRPAGARARERLLRVYFLAEARYRGKLGDGSVAWPGKAVWAGPERGLERAGATKGLGGEGYLTVFEDSASPRPGIDEVYFYVSPEQKPLERPPLIVTDEKPLRIPLDLLGLTAFMAYPAVSWARKRRAKQQAQS